MMSEKRKMFAAGVVMLLVLAGCAQTTVQAPLPSPIDSLRILTLRNDAMTVQIAPQIGRIYGLFPAENTASGGENLLWHDDPANILHARQNHKYINWGGDKIWPTLQSLWNRQRRAGYDWPPNPPIDGGEWNVISRSDRSIVMRSRLDDDLGIQVTRSITLDATLPRVTIRNTFNRLKPNPLPVMIWSVTQVHPPRMALLHIAADRPEGEWPVLNLGKPNEDPKAGLTVFPQAARWVPQPTTTDCKRGTFGRWIAAVYEHRILLQTTDYDPDACYGDRANIAVYRNTRYMELETVSPLVHLPPGRSLSNTVIWQLLDRPPLDDEKLADWLAEQAPRGWPASPRTDPVP